MLSINNIFEPQILAAEKDFLLVFKPPRMHSAPQVNSSGENIFEWCAALFGEIRNIPGRKAGEGGLLHRLDYETHGILLIARNEAAMKTFLAQEREGKIFKEYSALSIKSQISLPGFPAGKPIKEDLLRLYRSRGEFKNRLLIKSAFRPYGPGRKAVRPVFIDRVGKAGKAGEEKSGKLYSTEIIESRSISGEGSLLSLRLGLYKGFRHQIRCHLAWFGLPIKNDSLYGGQSSGDGLLALRACSLSFNDPSSGEKMIYSIPSLENNAVSVYTICGMLPN